MKFFHILPILALLPVILGLSTPVAAQSDAQAGAKPEVARVYILSGQSNMVGSGQAKELDKSWQQPIEGATIINKNKVQTLAAGESGGFGPEIGFAHYMTNNQPGKPKIYIIKFALSGQPLDAGWGSSDANGGGWAGPEPGPGRKTFYPGTSPSDPNIGLHYQKLHEYVAGAMKTLRDNGYAPEVHGIVWMQGEADAKNEVSAGRYDQTLALLKKRMEEDFTGGKDVPLVFGQVLPHDPPLDRFTHRDLIRRRMAEVDWRSGSERAVSNIWMVSTDGMPLNKDTVHYNTKGQLELGQAFGLEMLKAHRKAEEDGAKQY